MSAISPSAASLPRSGPSAGRRVWLAGLVPVAFVASVALPLWTYATTLACFGLAHVATELRYVDHRFGPRLGRRIVVVMIALLIAIGALRALRPLGLAGNLPLATLELGIGVGLCALILPVLARGGRWRLGLGVAVVAAIAAGIALSPIIALLALAALHNLTPLGFVAEVLRGRTRRRAMLVGAVVFVALPVLILSGWPLERLAAADWIALEFTSLPTGPLAAHFGAYLPTAWHLETWALHAFSAMVFLQCMHYVAVIGVLPTLHGDGDDTVVPWPSRRVFALCVAGASAVLVAGYAADFAQARSTYGVVAAIHAWIEVPLLLVALAPPPAPP